MGRVCSQERWQQMDQKTHWMATKDRKEEEGKTKTQMAGWPDCICEHSSVEIGAAQKQMAFTWGGLHPTLDGIASKARQGKVIFSAVGVVGLLVAVFVMGEEEGGGKRRGGLHK